MCGVMSFCLIAFAKLRKATVSFVVSIRPSFRLYVLKKLVVGIAEFYILLTVHTCIISQIRPTRCKILFNIFISLLYMFRASVCPSSGENYYIYATLVFVTLYGLRLQTPPI